MVDAIAILETGTQRLRALEVTSDPDDAFELDWLREQMAK